MESLPFLGFPLFYVGVAQAAPDRALPPDAPLYRAIEAADAKLFGAYNDCDLKTFGGMLGKDIEFFHDKGGVSTGRAAIVRSVRQNICGKLTRQLVPGSLKVYPMDRYGALELGVHRFIPAGGDAAGPAGEGRFIHLWKKVGSRWLLERVISYDHYAPGK